MNFSNVARWAVSLRGLLDSTPMTGFLRGLLKATEFERMQIPLAVVASDLVSGAPSVFRSKGDVVLPIRASCAYPGLFKPVLCDERNLVDGMVSMDIPVAPLREMGATHVVSVVLPAANDVVEPRHIASVVNRCFQIMAGRTSAEWQKQSNLVIEPEVAEIGWKSFDSTQYLIAAGENAARAALPRIREWLPQRNRKRCLGQVRLPFPSDSSVLTRG
jgi:NTE family protein